jgi:hypothetical protein
VCKSVLATDINPAGLIFDDCVVGGTYFKDFTIYNRSEIELFWILNTMDLSNQGDKSCLKFSDYETGESLSFDPIPPYSPKRIRITFKPLEVGEFNYDLQIENQNDSSNTIQTHIHATVNSVLRNDKLIVTSGQNLDFGDCCTGIQKRKHISLKNVSDTTIDVAFSSDNNGEVLFELRSDEKIAMHSKTKSKLRCDPRTMSDDSLQRDLSNSHLGLNDRLLVDRLNEISLLNNKSLSELSITRTRSLSSSMESLSYEDDQESSEIANSGTQSYNDDYNFLETRGDSVIQAEEVLRIEELSIRPGVEKTIDICYTPFKEILGQDYRMCRLAKKNFRLNLSYSRSGKSHAKERISIQCVSRVCTSAISVSPEEIFLGDTDVSTLKSTSINVRNCSDLPAVVELRYTSKIISSIRGEIIIPAQQNLEIKLDIYPRKVNPDYKKEIILANLLNPDNDQTIILHSTNVDKQRVTLHSLFYHILTPQSTHYVDFGTTVLNSTVVRSITLENITSKDVVLEICSSVPSDFCKVLKLELKSKDKIWRN